jgi:hypothetical protein
MSARSLGDECCCRRCSITLPVVECDSTCRGGSSDVEDLEDLFLLNVYVWDLLLVKQKSFDSIAYVILAEY